MAGPTNAGRKCKPKPHTIFYTFINNPQIFMAEEIAESAEEAVKKLEAREGTVYDAKVFEAKYDWFDSRLVGTRN